ncbi:MAG: hypothetical protein IIZ78_00980 [Clostridiales bacterium]|nr:hypothetical protein [Clostridiales bacterium]
MAQLTVPIVFDHDDLQRMVDEKIAEVKTQFIPKADYENRLKADMVAMLEDLRLDFQEAELAGVFDNKELIFADEVDDLVQQKINALKEAADDQSGAG